MYTAIKGIFEDGHVILEETPPTTKKSQVVVMFLVESDQMSPKSVSKGVKIGSLAGKGYRIPDDFNKSLDDLKEYM